MVQVRFQHSFRKVPGRFQEGSSTAPTERFQQGSSTVLGRLPCSSKGSSKVLARFQQGPGRFQESSRAVPAPQRLRFLVTTSRPRDLKPNRFAVGDIFLVWIGTVFWFRCLHFVHDRVDWVFTGNPHLVWAFACIQDFFVLPFDQTLHDTF